MACLAYFAISHGNYVWEHQTVWDWNAMSCLTLIMGPPFLLCCFCKRLNFELAVLSLGWKWKWNPALSNVFRTEFELTFVWYFIVFGAAVGQNCPTSIDRLTIPFLFAAISAWFRILPIWMWLWAVSAPWHGVSADIGKWAHYQFCD